MKNTNSIIKSKIKEANVRKNTEGYYCLNDIDNDIVKEWLSSDATLNFLLEYSKFQNLNLEDLIYEVDEEIWCDESIVYDFVIFITPLLRIRNILKCESKNNSKLYKTSPSEKAYEKLKFSILRNISHYGIDLKNKWYEDIDKEVDDLIENLNDIFTKVLNTVYENNEYSKEWTSIRALNYSFYNFSYGQCRAIGRIATAIHIVKRIKYDQYKRPHLYRKDILLTIMECAEKINEIRAIRLERLVDCFLALKSNDPNILEMRELKETKRL
jgi:hypothetical protein